MPAPVNSRSWLRPVLVANLVGQVGIVLTGGIVRLTGSGLGCPTFPECVRGSYIPVVHQPQGIHKYIEFGNRMLTFVITILAVSALVVVWRQVRGGRSARTGDDLALDHPRSDRRLLALGAVPFLGVLAQALIGGISVLTKLNPTVVAVHFLVSMVLIAASTVLLLTAAPGPGVAWRAPAWPRRLAVLAGLALAAVLALGTGVTGAGPHSGDAHDPNRFGFTVVAAAHLHSGAVWIFCGLVIALVVTLARAGAPAAVRRRAAVVLGLTVAQGVLGYLQYALGVPAGLVALHLLGASLLVVATTATSYAVLAGAGSGRAATASAGAPTGRSAGGRTPGAPAAPDPAARYR